MKNPQSRKNRKVSLKQYQIMLPSVRGGKVFGAHHLKKECKIRYPPSKRGQRVTGILGAIALQKLCLHVNAADQCLEIKEERVIEDD